jgi:hypothetical protein
MPSIALIYVRCSSKPGAFRPSDSASRSVRARARVYNGWYRRLSSQFHVTLDILRYLLTPYPRAIRAMGFPTEVAGVRARYLRRKTEWAEHLEKSRSVILGGAQRAEQKRKAVILGGGLLHDVPLADLAGMFREVVLVDLIHPLASRWQTRRLRNVRRVTADVTETIAAAYRVAWDADKPLPKSAPKLFLDEPEVDFVASVNLLSQLPCMPIAYLTQQAVHTKEAINEYARDLIRAHLKYLGRMSGRVALITDFERLKIAPSGEVVERRDLFFGVPWPNRGEEWEWKLAPRPEADRTHHYYRRVVGIPDWK